MDPKDPQSEPERRKLSESIDALLGEIDSSCADFEGEGEGGAGAGATPASNASAGERGGSDEPDGSDAATDGAADGSRAGHDTIKALDAVTSSAEALLEDTIGELLEASAPAIESIDEADETHAGTDSEDPESPVCGSPASDDVEDLLASIADGLSDGSEDASLSEVADDPDGPGGATEGAIEEPIEDVTIEDAPAAGLDDGLLESINRELAGDGDRDSDLAQEERAQGARESGAIQSAAQAMSEDESPGAQAGEEAGEEAESPGAPDATEPVQERVLGDLDDALASIGDELLMGDFTNARGEVIDSSAMEGSIDPAMLLDQLDLPSTLARPARVAPGAAEHPRAAERGEPASKDTGRGGGAGSGETIAPVIESLSKVMPVRGSQGAPGAAKPARAGGGLEDELASSAEIASIWQKLAGALGVWGSSALGALKASGGPNGAKLVLLLSRPLAKKSATVRDSVGYLALWTLLLAMILWIHVAFFRASPAPSPEQAPTRVVTPGEDLEPIEHQLDERP